MQMSMSYTMNLENKHLCCANGIFMAFSLNIKKFEQEASLCDETRFSTIQPSIDVTGIRNKRWQ